MVDIIVKRGEGDKPGHDIFEPLLATIPVAIERGRSEIDSESDIQSVVMECVYRSNVEKGQLIEVLDILQGKTWRGKLVGIQHTLDGSKVITELTVHRPTEFSPV